MTSGPPPLNEGKLEGFSLRRTLGHGLRKESPVDPPCAKGGSQNSGGPPSHPSSIGLTDRDRCNFSTTGLAPASLSVRIIAWPPEATAASIAVGPRSSHCFASTSQPASISSRARSRSRSRTASIRAVAPS